jgi:hypothetical protein
MLKKRYGYLAMIVIGTFIISLMANSCSAYSTPDTRIYNIHLVFDDGYSADITSSQNMNIAGHGNVASISVYLEYYPLARTFPDVGITELKITGGPGEAYLATIPNDNSSFIGYGYGIGGTTQYTSVGYANGTVDYDFGANNTYTFKVTVAAENGKVTVLYITMYNDPEYGDQDRAAGIVIEQSMGVVGALFMVTGILFGIYVSRVADVMQGSIVAIMFESIGGMLVYYFVLGG